MGTNLANISAELFAWIARYLDTQDLGNLRLLNRELAQKAVLGSFSESFRARRIELTRKSLQACAQALSSDANLGRFVEDVTLVRIICDSSRLERWLKFGGFRKMLYQNDQAELDMIEKLEAKGGKLKDGFIDLDDAELDQIEESIDDLAEQQEEMELHEDEITRLLSLVFSRLKAQAHSLKRLSLQVAVLEDPRRPPSIPRDAPRSTHYPVLDAAAHTYSLFMSSIQDLPINTMDLFNARPESLQCSVPCDLLARTTFQSQNSLQSLSISVLDTLSATMVYPGGYKNPDMDRLTAAVLQDENFTGLSRFLNACPALEELRISYYNIPDRKPVLIKQAYALIPRQMHELAKNVHHPRLRSLSLSGLKVDCRDFIEYLTKHRATLQSLELRDCKIKKDTGLLSDVMDCLQGFALTTIFLDGVFSDGSLCLYSGEREQAHTKISGYYLGQSTILRTGDDVRKPLEYWHRRGPMVHSIDTPKTRERQKLRRAEYGSW